MDSPILTSEEVGGIPRLINKIWPYNQTIFSPSLGSLRYSPFVSFWKNLCPFGRFSLYSCSDDHSKFWLFPTCSLCVHHGSRSESPQCGHGNDKSQNPSRLCVCVYVQREREIQMDILILLYRLLQVALPCASHRLRGNKSSCMIISAK